MSRKQLPFFERHAERFAIAVAIVTTGTIVTRQSLHAPSQVEGYDAASIDDALVGTADRLAQQLEPDAAAAIALPPVEPAAPDFTGAIAQGVAPADRLTASHAAATIDGGGAPAAMVAFVVPDLPAPGDPIVAQHFAALDDELVSSQPALQERFERSPYDISWTTPAAMIDLEAVRAALAAERPDAVSIPREWYRDRLEVVDVRVERQERVDGAWSHPVTIAPLADAITLRSKLEMDADRSLRDDIRRALDAPGVRASILQPPFLPTRDDAWVADFDAEPVTDDEDAAVGARRALGRLRQSRDAVASALEAAGAAPTDPAPPSQGRSDPPGPQLGPSGSSRRTGPATGAVTAPARVERLRQRLADLEARIAALSAELGLPATPAARARLDRDRVWTWAHDIGAEPGHVYRYRFTLELLNPFFAHRLALLESQVALSEPLTWRSPPSAWSAAYAVMPMSRLWITRADGPDAGSLGLGRATAEVYRFHDGRWWRDAFSVTPGERIGAARSAPDRSEPIDFRTPWFVSDVLERADGTVVVLRDLLNPERSLVLDPRAGEVDAVRRHLRARVKEAQDRG